MTWTHAVYTENIHEAKWLVSPEGELRAHDHRPEDPSVARLYVTIRIYKDEANIRVLLVDTKCAPYNDQHCTPQFVLNADATPDSSHTIVETAHRAVQDLARFYAALRSVTR